MGVILDQLAAACIVYKNRSKGKLMYMYKDSIIMSPVSKFITNFKKYNDEKRRNEYERHENTVSIYDTGTKLNKKQSRQAQAKRTKGTATYKQRNKLDD